MIPKPKYTTYDIYIRDDSENLHVLKNSILNGLTIRIPIPDTTEKYRIPHILTSHIEAELQTYMLTKEERRQAKQEGKAAYDKGLADAWEVAREIVTFTKDGGLSVEALEKIFGTQICEEIIRDFDVFEAITKIKTYEKEQKEIKVGDEIIYQYNDREKTGVVYDVMNFSDSNVYLIFSPFELNATDSVTSEIDKIIRKTGRHFPQVEALLKAMKGE